MTDEDATADDPVADAIEQARRGGRELAEATIDYLKKIRDEKGPGVRFVIKTQPTMGLIILDAKHEEWLAERDRRHANLPDWVRQMYRAAVAIAIPDWTWRDGDDVDFVTFTTHNSSRDFTGIGGSIQVFRPGTDEEADAFLEGEEFAQFLHRLLSGGPLTPMKEGDA
jgi:hypothetical protein